MGLLGKMFGNGVQQGCEYEEHEWTEWKDVISYESPQSVSNMGMEVKNTERRKCKNCQRYEIRGGLGDKEGDH